MSGNVTMIIVFDHAQAFGVSVIRHSLATSGVMFLFPGRPQFVVEPLGATTPNQLRIHVALAASRTNRLQFPVS